MFTRCTRPWPARVLLAVLCALGVLLWQPPVAGRAHPAPSVIHDYLVRLGPGTAQVFLRLAVDPTLVPQVYRQIDTNGDGVTQPQERQAWLDKYLANMRFTVDDQPAMVGLVSASAADQRNFVVSMQHPVTVTMQLTFTLPADAPNAIPADHHFVLSDNTNYVGYDEYNASWEDVPGAITTAHDLTQPANPAMFEAVFERDPTTAPPPAATPAPLVTNAVPQESLGAQFADRLDEFLRDPHADMRFGLLLFVLAAGLGAAHALTPGHGKAVVAAYLVGSRGRVRDAIALGSIVTLTHTMSVVVLGVVLLVISNFILPRWLLPGLEVASGMLIVVLGLYLLANRLRTYLRGTPAATAHTHTHADGTTHSDDHTYEHSHDHGHTHDHANEHQHAHDHDHAHDHGHTHDHDHGPGGHSHVPPPGASARDLIALGVSGGLIPCPDALTILLLSVPIGQIGFGLLMVSSFSLGLAAVLIAIGVLMVKARGLLERLMPGRGGENPAWVRVVPVVSAIIVVVLGVALMISAIAGQKWA
jgi:ABC-type nickel/cobalt efflux system permease component RcnA